MGHIKRSDLSSSMVLIPSPKELISMDEIISPMIDKLVANSKLIKTLEKLRDMLLQKLMSGEVGELWEE
jgi:restriction endonuclease S subunit